MPNRIIDYNRVKDFWDRSAECSLYSDDIQAGMLSVNKLAAYYRKYQEEHHFDKILSLNKNMTVLEVGCGTGRWAFYFANKVKKVTAIDISDKMIAIARKKQINAGIKNIEFICSSALDFDTLEKYNLVYFSGVLQYMEDADIEIMLTKLPNWMRSDGLCVSRDTLSLKKRIVLTGDYPVVYRTKEEHENLFKKHGFELVYSGKSYNSSISSATLAHYLEKYAPMCSLRTLLILNNILQPFDGVLKFIYKKKYGVSWDQQALNDKLSHEFLVYRLMPIKWSVDSQ